MTPPTSHPASMSRIVIAIDGPAASGKSSNLKNTPLLGPPRM